MARGNVFNTSGFELEKIVIPLLDWYAVSKRVLPWRENTDPYRVWVSEIMLQQTRVDTVIPYYNRFLERLPDIQSLAQVPEEELLKLWEGLGYYSRVRNMQRAARVVVKDFDGKFPVSYRDIQSLPGIGPYTAGAISSIAFEQPVPAVDGNVMRVLSRITESRADIADPSVKRQMTAALADIYPAGRCGDFTQSLMELGAIICLPNGAPLCARCPLNGLCRAYRSGTQMDYPVQAPKPERRKETKTVLLLCCGNDVALRRRPEGGLLGGLWEFPCLEGEMTPDQIQADLSERGIHTLSVEKAGTQRHIFTHIEWRMQAYRVQCPERAEGLRWVTRTALEEQVALPTAFKKLCRYLVAVQS